MSVTERNTKMTLPPSFLHPQRAFLRPWPEGERTEVQSSSTTSANQSAIGKRYHVPMSERRRPPEPQERPYKTTGALAQPRAACQRSAFAPILPKPPECHSPS